MPVTREMVSPIATRSNEVAVSRRSDDADNKDGLRPRKSQSPPRGGQEVAVKEITATDTGKAYGSTCIQGSARRQLTRRWDDPVAGYARTLMHFTVTNRHSTPTLTSTTITKYTANDSAYNPTNDRQPSYNSPTTPPTTPPRQLASRIWQSTPKEGKKNFHQLVKLLRIDHTSVPS